ncbi:MAG: hypothetical protein KDM63_19095 [Verrucomicrobiae bacterium]|nr:hypothetical protein [Verrucomicrobiae bacterium]
MSASEVGQTLKGLKPRWETVPSWKRKLLYGAAALGLFGAGSDTMDAWKGEPQETPAASAPSLRTDLAAPAAATQATAGEPVGPVREFASRFTWGGATGRLGLSFSIAFLAALAIRWFIKTALTVIGLAAAGIAVLVHYGVIDASHFGDTTEWAKTAGPWLAEQTESFTNFLKGHLPSGAASGAGLFLGLRK